MTAAHVVVVADGGLWARTELESSSFLLSAPDPEAGCLLFAYSLLVSLCVIW